MKLNKRLHQYYEEQLENIDDIKPMQVPDAAKIEVKKRGIFNRWEEWLGYAITIGYLTQMLFPSQWFALGRFLSVFKFGF